MAASLNDACKCLNSLQELFMCLEGAPPSMNTIRRAFTALAMYAFSNVRYMDGFSENLACRTYSSDPAKTQIRITAQGAYDPGNTENIPGIVISLGDGLKLERLGIGDTAHTGANFSVRIPAYKGTLDVVFKCRDYDADVSCYMSDLLLLFFTSIQERMYETWGWLISYAPSTQTEPELKTKEGDSDTKWYESTVRLNITLAYEVFTSREAPPLKDASVDAYTGEDEIDEVSLRKTIVPFDGNWNKHRS